MDKLEKCPFCGCKADLFHIPENTEEENSKHPRWRWNNPGMWIVGCGTDDCIGSIDNYSMIFATKEKAIKAWNRRAKAV